MFPATGSGSPDRDAKKARGESIRHLLSNLDDRGGDEASTSLMPDPGVVTGFHPSVIFLD